MRSRCPMQRSDVLIVSVVGCCLPFLDQPLNRLDVSSLGCRVDGDLVSELKEHAYMRSQLEPKNGRRERRADGLASS